MKVLVVSLILMVAVVTFELCAFVIAAEDDERNEWK